MKISKIIIEIDKEGFDIICRNATENPFYTADSFIQDLLQDIEDPELDAKSIVEQDLKRSFSKGFGISSDLVIVKLLLQKGIKE